MTIADKVTLITALSPELLKQQILIRYSELEYLTECQGTFDILRNSKLLNSVYLNIFKQLPFMIFVKNIISDNQLDIIKQFMTNSTDRFTPPGDNRIYYFSESYQIYFQKGLKINPIHAKGANSPTKKVDDQIHILCKHFYAELKKQGVDYGKGERQMNVFLTTGKIENNNKSHVRWHRYEDSEQIPDYSMVILLDDLTWIGGNLLCQYTGRNINVYRKKIFDSPIIHFIPQFKCGIILRNYDTRHMVDLINSSQSNLTTTRSVIVLQLYKKLYAYD